MVNMVMELVKVCDDREWTRKPPPVGDEFHLTLAVVEL